MTAHSDCPSELILKWATVLSQSVLSDKLMILWHVDITVPDNCSQLLADDGNAGEGGAWGQ